MDGHASDGTGRDLRLLAYFCHDLCLVDDQLGGCGLLVRRVAVLEQEPLDPGPQLGPHRLLDVPVGLGVPSHDLGQLVCDLLHRLVGHDRLGGLVVRQGVVVEELHLVADRRRLLKGGDQGEEPLETAGMGHEPLLGTGCLLALPVELTLATIGGVLVLAVGLEEVVHGRRHRVDERLGVAASQDGDPIHAVQQVGHHAVLGQHVRDRGLADVLTYRAALLVPVGVGRQRGLEVLGDADVVHDQAGGLVLERPVHPGDGLHEPVPCRGG